ncbi:MAG: cysteine--tRNA ligase [Symbiobacteriia bacterium]
MSIRVYNTLSREKEDFTPRDPGRASIYVCGVTPYDQSHVGHARPSIVWDVIRNYLEYTGLKVRLVQNFTDVDDKIIARSREQQRPALELSAQYSAEYLRSMERLGIREADIYSKVSEHIEDIIRMIQGLMDTGLAYAVEGDVYYDVTRFAEYGKLSGRSLDDLKAGARVEVDERKRNPGDFALWKAAKAGEPAWESPWGPGRPGWHIECSAMSLRYLGNGFDFHGGGSDLIFPHHENEIAQSEGFTGHAPFVRHWLHNGLVNLRAEKMSKSLGNVISLNSLLDHFSSGAVRFFMLTTHYRSPMDFDENLVQEAEAGWTRLVNTRSNLAEAMRQAGVPGASGGSSHWGHDGAVRAAELQRELDQLATSPAPPRPAERDLQEAILVSRQRLEEAMNDDFNTALAMAALFDLTRAINTYLNQSEQAEPASLSLAWRWYGLLGDLFGLFTDLQEAAHGGAADVALRVLLELRQEARQEKNWALADRIRDRLADAGYTIEDAAGGPKVKRKS